MAGKRDYYEVLGIEKDATTEMIEKAYRRLARQYHPDRNIGDPEAEVKFKEVTEARDILCDEQKRAAYDRYGHAGLEGGGGRGYGPTNSANDLFSDLINSFFGGGGETNRRRSGPQPGRNVQVVLDISLAEAATGIQKSFTFPRLDACQECSGRGSKSGQRNRCERCHGKGVETVGHAGGFIAMQRTCSRCHGEGTYSANPCNTCRGSGRQQSRRTIEINVPAGVDTGMRMEVRGEGEAGDPGAPRGDLEVVFRVGSHPDFERDGSNLIAAVPISFSQAALGASIEIPTLTGTTTLEIPRGTQTHTEIRVRGEGMPNLRSGRRGDLRVIVVVATPNELSPRQEELLRELAGIEQKEVAEEKKGFLDRIKGLFRADHDEKR